MLFYYYRREEGIFQWTRCQDGVLSKASYVKWLPNEPDNGRNFLKANVTHDCVAWHWSYESGWADQYCEDTFPFICEVIFVVLLAYFPLQITTTLFHKHWSLF